MAKPPKLQVVQGSRVTVRKPKGTPGVRRVIFIPNPDGSFLCLDHDAHYPLRLKWAVELTVPEDAVFVEMID